MSRTRETSTLTESNSVPLVVNVSALKFRKYYYNGWQYETDEVSTDLTTYYRTGVSETITDEVSNRSFKPVSHIKSSSFVVPSFTHKHGTLRPINEWPNTYGNWYTGEITVSRPAFSPHWSSWCNNIPSPSVGSIDWDDLVSSVGSSLDGTMQAGTSLLVNLAELGQTIGMIKNPWNLKKLPRSMKRGLSFGKIAKTSANTWLEYRYGWSNLYRDIKALAVMYEKVSDHLAFLEKTRDSWQSVAASDELTGQSQWYPQRYVSVGATCMMTLEPVNKTVKGVFSLDVKRTQALNQWSWLKAAIEYTGVKDVAVALWDLVPYSFVVDWFIGVNKLLGRNPVDWNSYQLLNVGHSLKEESTARVKTYSSISTYWDGTSVKTEYSDQSSAYKTYVRTLGIPESSIGAGLFGGLSIYQLADAASLIVQRL